MNLEHLRRKIREMIANGTSELVILSKCQGYLASDPCLGIAVASYFETNNLRLLISSEKTDGYVTKPTTATLGEHLAAKGQASLLRVPVQTTIAQSGHGPATVTGPGAGARYLASPKPSPHPAPGTSSSPRPPVVCARTIKRVSGMLLLDRSTPIGKTIGDCNKEELTAIARLLFVDSRFIAQLALSIPPVGLCRDYIDESEAAAIYERSKDPAAIDKATVDLTKPADYREVTNNG
jgi:hypothetical protein